ncbi:MAG TPA: RNA-binding protein [Methylomirabilota bacterium]|nr:RNA-binding protein [Methylomirabilota bacterium]
MISNERPSSFGHRNGFNGHSGQGSHGYGGPKQAPVAEDTLRSDKIQIERKTFVFSLRENPRGRFLRITEDVNGRRDTIIIPATGLEDFRRVVEDMLQTSNDTPPKTA